ncbi:MAG: carbohydrate ABC transporter permease [Caldilineaceae bacterium]|nr:carbohydrate ABC transporter permease [Caldilineaceae bacterium]MCB9139997.1 carbohydrate ABC transporter permease [Caldilineaceae bacterium]
MTVTTPEAPLEIPAKQQGIIKSLLVQSLLLLGGIFMLAPFLVMLLVSLFPADALLTRNFALERITLQNYVETFQVVPFGRYYFNSALVAIVTTTAQLVVASLAAFAFARLRFRGRESLFLLYLATLMIPFIVLLIPNFLIIRQLKWFNSYWALIVPSIFSAFTTFFLRQYYRGLPIDLDEAARLDGASSFRIWHQVILPLSTPALAAIGIFAFNNSWNDFLWPLVVTATDEMRTIPVGLAAFQGQFSTDWNLLMAGAVIALLPVLIIYILSQNWFIRGIALSGMGGR